MQLAEIRDTKGATIGYTTGFSWQDLANFAVKNGLTSAEKVGIQFQGPHAWIYRKWGQGYRLLASAILEPYQRYDGWRAWS